VFAAIHSRRNGVAGLLGCARDFSPRVEETSADTVTFDAHGLARLFGSPRELGEAIARRAAGLGLEASIALAANPDAAMHGARGFPGVTVMEPGREASLPIELLDPPPDMAVTLAMWGIRTFGEFAALPEEGVAERLGAAGAALQKLARGKGERPLVPADPEPPFAETIELDYPLTLTEPLSFLLGRLLNQLCARLNQRGLATHELRMTLALEQAAAHERTLRLPFPMRDAPAFLKLLALDVDMHPPGAPVTAVTITAEPVNPRVVQHGLFLPLAPEPQKLELTLARILKLVGEGNAGAAELLDTHRPGAFRMRRFAPGESNGGGRAAARRVALRVFRPPLPARVQAFDGRPERLAARGIRGKVTESAGPWRTSGDWWREDAWSRDEWDIGLSDGAIYRVFRDRRNEEWYVEGYYD
jgi:protein ImuB